MLKENWQKMTIYEQMGNIMSEIGRAINWEKKNDLEAKNNSLTRSLELIDLTLNNKKNKNSLKEISRLRELVADNYSGNKIYNTTLSDLYNCLLPFAIIARR